MPHYVRITPGEPLPDVSQLAPFRAVVVLDGEYSGEWQNEVSDWLIRRGCLYMLAWGPNCSSWDDSVDWANLQEFDFGDIPDHRFVMTTWHEDETLESVLWFAGSTAHHPDIELKETVIVHVGAVNRELEFLRLFEQAKTLPQRESE